MKLLACGHCKTHALHPATRLHPEGTPAIAGRMTASPMVVQCIRCGRATRLTFTEFNSLPDLTLEDFERLGFGDLPIRDLEGFGLRRDEARDALRQGWTVDELHAISRGAERTD